MSSQAHTQAHAAAARRGAGAGPLPWAVAGVALLGVALWWSERADQTSPTFAPTFTSTATPPFSPATPTAAADAPTRVALPAGSTAAALAPSADSAAPEPAAKAPNEPRLLRFLDQANGDILAIDARTGTTLARYQGEQGFLRGTLRAMARERARRQLGPDAPLMLVSHSPGRLALLDPATGQQIALESFGATNLAVFASLQTAPAQLKP